MKPKNWFESLNCAIEGILYVVKNETHMKYHFAIAGIVLIISLFLNLSTFEFVLLAVSITFVLFAEVINTAFEVITDMITREYNPTIKAVKDMAAGGVLIASIGAAVMGYWILSRHIFQPIKFSFVMVKRSSELVAIITLIIVIILVVILKSKFGKGKPLHGGFPSGHAAISFSIWTAVSLITLDPLVTILTFITAVMVSHSRLLLEIHTIKEVIAGAMLGILTTVVIFKTFG
ncbi:MAG: diacylglycerol kinase [Nitrospinae bacterium RIFCSPLOWO2_02_FULL_39_110]|nr:MAG: diacylglycerol kinase [Nitrospinae bacterium RIFCSPHIGHO2_12_FULL_39_42]OGW01618.1 MAG: diacylglycerol kinase [Nitrospinae bacterium RIFCSPHIGHO2_02_FULL_39_82]OGW02228.1 MAG: diacylglycerol kinase [Nitrospinae bacterium RIFCSPLOWO2_02_39_17]OGW06039.1 MAG: diacylglycerol kinase [Nitrospinae bacterium RIFCSPLOWO2_02_FULL_39_110]HLA48637.1 diacylglycerol kinase [Nitrospinota bacterium]